ncbi:hypothetical protein AVEN_179818-1 [Araneus ventricosus]|uniref:Uncharacterized protein n=1 Tax=Araneus ventricosus TaxID=182803 RepID=A0A4Y2FB96_ARAVE|nr:hypothetical protein AVEN_179818-1 [Araneus ventricosus]
MITNLTNSYQLCARIDLDAMEEIVIDTSPLKAEEGEKKEKQKGTGNPAVTLHHVSVRLGMELLGKRTISERAALVDNCGRDGHGADVLLMSSELLHRLGYNEGVIVWIDSVIENGLCK